MTEQKPVKFHALFLRNFNRRIKNKRRLIRLYKKQFTLFLQCPEHPDLRNHQLRANLHDYRAIFIDNDCRIIYRETEDFYLFYNIGNHKEV